MAVPYRKSEMLEIYCVPFWTNANKSKTLRQFCDPLDPFKKKFINRTLSQLSKTVRDLKIGQTLAKRLIEMGHPTIILWPEILPNEQKTSKLFVRSDERKKLIFELI